MNEREEGHRKRAGRAPDRSAVGIAAGVPAPRPGTVGEGGRVARVVVRRPWRRRARWWRAVPVALALLLALPAGSGTGAGATGESPPPDREGRDLGPGRHTRPVALAVDADGKTLFVALSTADRLVALDVSALDAGSATQPPPVRWERRICAQPTALAALPKGGVVVSCRFDPELRVVTTGSGGEPRIERVDAGPEHGQRGVAVDPGGRFAYVASIALGGVKVVPLPAPVEDGVDGARRSGAPPHAEVRPGGQGKGAPMEAQTTSRVRFRGTGLGATTVRLWSGDGGARASSAGPLLLVVNRIAHTVTVHRPSAEGDDLSAAVQTITTAGPVLDVTVTRAGLFLFTTEDREVSRLHRDVEGLDSVMLLLPWRRSTPGGDEDGAATPAAERTPFADAGPGRRRTINLGEWQGESRGEPQPESQVESQQRAVVSLEAAAFGGGDPTHGGARLVVAGAGSDNVWLSPPLPTDDVPASWPSAADAALVPVGANPAAVSFLPGGTVVTADRLSDTLTFFTPPREGRPAVVRTVAVGDPLRRAPAELGELLFFSRDLVPHNTAAGALSLYTCAACHVDGHIDGRRHPSKFNRFRSMTKTCRALGGTEPFLSLGHPATLAAFADNIVNTHAQGAAAAPATFDQYDVHLRVAGAPELGSPAGAVAWKDVRLSPGELRAALAAYMAAIPREPSPFLPPGQRHLGPAERRGLALFEARCASCHRLVRTTADRVALASSDRLERELLAGRVALTAASRFDVGTPVLGDGGNNPPSLRGVWAAAPYFSDGSAITLEEVLDRTDPAAEKVHAPANAGRGAGAFSPAERADLLALLRVL